MITSFLISILYNFLLLITYPIRAFSDVALPPQISAAIVQANYSLNLASPFVPIGTILAVFGSVIGVEILILAYRLVKLLIPFKA